MIDIAYKRTRELLSNHREQLTAVASRLLEREVIFKEDLEQIFGKRKWDEEAQEKIPSINGKGGLNGVEKKTGIAESAETPSIEKKSPESPVS